MDHGGTKLLVLNVVAGWVAGGCSDDEITINGLV